MPLSCGFQSVRSVVEEGLSVEVDSTQNIEPALLEGMLAGARSWLSAQGVKLRPGAPMLRLEILAVEEQAGGITLQGAEPVGRSVRWIVRGRALYLVGKGSKDTHIFEEQMIGEDTALEGVGGAREQALRSVGWRLGEVLVRSMWGRGSL